VLNEPFEALEVFPVEFVSRSEIDRYTMLYYPVLFENRVQHFQGSASIHHEILRDDFKPVDDRFFCENVPVMWHAQPYADAVFGESIESICGHNVSGRDGFYFVPNDLWNGLEAIPPPGWFRRPACRAP
jgi:hypothetical protein